MEQTETTTTEGGGARIGTPELVRPLQGRMLAGVAQAISNRYDLHPWVPRVLFLISAFVGGLGVALYLAGWALIRSEDETETPAARFFSGAASTRSWVGIGLIFIAAMILLDSLTFFSGGVIWAGSLLVLGVLLYMGQIPMPRSESTGPKEGAQEMTTKTTDTTVVPSPVGSSVSGGATTPPVRPTPTPPILPPGAPAPKARSMLGRITVGLMLIAVGVLAILDITPGVAVDARPRHYLALAITVLGLGLVVGAFAGRARWLILVGAILIPTLLFSPAMEYDWDSDEFGIALHPVTFAELDRSYSTNVGDLDLDLTSLPWDGQTIALDLSLDAGRIRIWVPEDVAIDGTARVKVGQVRAPSGATAGLGSPTLELEETGSLGTLVLNARVDVGSIEIYSESTINQDQESQP